MLLPNGATNGNGGITASRRPGAPEPYSRSDGFRRSICVRLGGKEVRFQFFPK